jgi:hypothetical protein
MITYRDRLIPVFSLPPNWKQAIVVTEEWGTFIRESLDTSEQRRGSRPRPLYKIEFSTLSLSAQEQGYVRKVLEASNDMPIAVPFWQDAVDVSIASTAGNPWIDVEFTANTLFGVLPYMMVWTGFKTFETHRVALVNATQIQVVDSMDASWPVGAKVVPVAVGKLAKQKTQSLTDVNGVFKAKFEEVFLNEGPMLCQTISGTTIGASLPFIEECVGGALL